MYFHFLFVNYFFFGIHTLVIILTYIIAVIQRLIFQFTFTVLHWRLWCRIQARVNVVYRPRR